MKLLIHVTILTIALLSCDRQNQQFSSAKSAEHPNFIFVLIDDMGYGDLPVYGNAGVETPHIDRLAKEGVRFTQFYVNAPICSPSRVAFSTGQYPLRWDITSYLPIVPGIIIVEWLII